jgi:hypothetical protein
MYMNTNLGFGKRCALVISSAGQTRWFDSILITMQNRRNTKIDLGLEQWFDISSRWLLLAFI